MSHLVYVTKIMNLLLQNYFIIKLFYILLNAHIILFGNAILPSQQAFAGPNIGCTDITSE
jgi:hypothetical protein